MQKVIHKLVARRHFVADIAQSRYDRAAIARFSFDMLPKKKLYGDAELQDIDIALGQLSQGFR